ncbi:amino acid adenylation domain-containing protein [Streptomyces albogriseolus]
MWAADQAAAPEAPYNVSLAWRMPADADRTALGAAVDALVRRHPVLGCRVRPLDGRPALQPAPEPPALVIRTVAGAALDGAVRAEGDRRLRTSAEPLLRAVLWEPEDGGAPVLQLTTHHMVVDGRSADLLGRDLAALSTGGELPPALPFATAVRRELRRAEDDASGRAEAERRFAERLADGRAAGVLFPGGGERAGAAGGHREHRLPAALADTLARVAEDAGVPRFTVLLGAFAAALSRTTGHRSFLVAVPVYGRGGGQEDHSVGCFATTVPLRVDLDPGRPVHAWLRELNQEVRAALGRSVVPYPRLAELCREAGGPDAVPTVTLAYQNWERDAAGTAAGAGWEQVYRRGQRGHFDLGLEVTDTGHGLDVLANHRTAVLGADEADAFVEELRRSAAELARGAGGTLGDLLDPAAGTLTARIAATARRLPDAVAVEDRDTRLSYAELQQVSDEIARRVHHAAGPGEPVAVLMHRSARLPAVLLGILKSGRPYVPLDESYPSERLALVVERAGCCVAVADRELTWLLPQGVHVVDPRGPAGPDVPHGPPPTPPTPDSPAYLMFTSGSTGQPKGVAVTHGNVVHTLEALAATVGVDERAPARLLAVTTVCFDISVLELFLPLLTGGTVVVAERADVTDARRLARLLTERDIGLMQATPAGWHLLVEGGWTGRGTLTALCGGEALPPNLAAALTARTAALWNVYGPTEATIWSTIAPVTASGPVHLGDPIGATRLLLTEVDGRRPPAPGEPGELWIGGAGVAQGYWRQPELTAERFTGHPLSPEGGGRWFRTGDLVRRDEEGRLLFLGRADSQVKVRGHRMELGEIEEGARPPPGDRPGRRRGPRRGALGQAHGRRRPPGRRRPARPAGTARARRVRPAAVDAPGPAGRRGRAAADAQRQGRPQGRRSPRRCRPRRCRPLRGRRSGADDARLHRQSGGTRDGDLRTARTGGHHDVAGTAGTRRHTYRPALLRPRWQLAAARAALRAPRGDLPRHRTRTRRPLRPAHRRRPRRTPHRPTGRPARLRAGRSPAGRRRPRPALPP